MKRLQDSRAPPSPSCSLVLLGCLLNLHLKTLYYENPAPLTAIDHKYAYHANLLRDIQGLGFRARRGSLVSITVHFVDRCFNAGVTRYSFWQGSIILTIPHIYEKGSLTMVYHPVLQGNMSFCCLLPRTLPGAATDNIPTPQREWLSRFQLELMVENPKPYHFALL